MLRGMVAGIPLVEVNGIGANSLSLIVAILNLPVRPAARYIYGWDGHRLAVVGELGESFYITAGAECRD